MKIKLTWRIWFLIILLLISVLAMINFSGFKKGVLVTSVDLNSTAYESGLRQGQIITKVDSSEILNIEDYSKSLEGKFTDKTNVKTVIQTTDSEIILFSNEAPEITTTNIPKTNLKLGLDLAGGARAIVKAQDKDLTSAETNDIADIISNRLNTYGISDLSVLPISDLNGNNFILIEIAGATPKDLENLISQQGKFEAKIGNETVFVGGEKDISSVCRGDAKCAAVEGCYANGNGYYCNFRFSVYLSEDAAKRHAEITKNIPANLSSGGYLSKKLDLLLDDLLVDSLLISEGLRGNVATQISISGSGTGATKEEAVKSAEEQMHKLQTVLITGSLPLKLEIVKLDTISPTLGKEFVRSILLAGFLSLGVVSILMFVRYRRIKSSAALLLTSFSEIVIILGISAMIGWNLDLPSIAGILATIGTGVDQQIIILDETKQGKSLTMKQKMKRALGIIIGAYLTVVTSLFPLLWAGAGLLKGFVITSFIGVTVGVLITRPAFTDMIKRIEEKEESKVN